MIDLIADVMCTAGLGFYLHGVLYPNNSIVNIQDIGAGTNALFCLTDRMHCCRKRDGGASGEWYLPGESDPIPGASSATDRDTFRKQRWTSVVALIHNNNPTTPLGLYRCEVMDSNNITQSVYVGVYGANGGENYVRQ